MFFGKTHSLQDMNHQTERINLFYRTNYYIRYNSWQRTIRMKLRLNYGKQIVTSQLPYHIYPPLSLQAIKFLKTFRQISNFPLLSTRSHVDCCIIFIFHNNHKQSTDRIDSVFTQSRIDKACENGKVM